MPTIMRVPLIVRKNKVKNRFSYYRYTIYQTLFLGNSLVGVLGEEVIASLDYFLQEANAHW
jgi:hypothetical protein